MEGDTHEQAERRQLAAQLERLKREEQRLGDACQAEVIPLEELADRRALLGQRRRGLPYQPVRFEVRAELGVDVIGDWRDLGTIFPPASFDVVVWDPPHINDAGRNGIVGGQGVGLGVLLGCRAPCCRGGAPRPRPTVTTTTAP